MLIRQSTQRTQKRKKIVRGIEPNTRLKQHKQFGKLYNDVAILILNVCVHNFDARYSFRINGTIQSSDAANISPKRTCIHNRTTITAINSAPNCHKSNINHTELSSVVLFHSNRQRCGHVVFQRVCGVSFDPTGVYGTFMWRSFAQMPWLHTKQTRRSTQMFVYMNASA